MIIVYLQESITKKYRGVDTLPYREAILTNYKDMGFFIKQTFLNWIIL